MSELKIFARSIIDGYIGHNEFHPLTPEFANESNEGDFDFHDGESHSNATTRTQTKWQELEWVVTFASLKTVCSKFTVINVFE